MEKKYLLGVDGGNTKTDFMLFDSKGNFVDHLRAGTCSHESVKDSFAGAKRELNKNLTILCERSGISRREIAASVFGLAGIDTSMQQQKLTKILEELGFKNFIALNDSFLSIKAVSRDGTGVCSINGTGTVTGGIDRRQKYLQVGGIGAAAGDCAGGRNFSMRAIQAVYNALFRNGSATDMTQPMLTLLGVENDETLMAAISEQYYGRKIKDLEFMKILFSAANRGDEAAVAIVTDIAGEMANSVIGCVQRLDFGEEVNIITAGSIWMRCETPLLYREFCRVVQQGLRQKCIFLRPEFLPICGAINWAFQLYEGVEQGCLRMESISRVILQEMRH